jgi:hypothetical protein
VCSGQKSQPPFSASTGNYGVPAKESNVGNGQGDTIAPMRNMILEPMRNKKQRRKGLSRK